jgi:hypothetical protein
MIYQALRLKRQQTYVTFLPKPLRRRGGCRALRYAFGILSLES